MADALSRKVDDDLGGDVDQVPSSVSLCLISFPCPSWIEELKAIHVSSLEAKKILKELQYYVGCPRFFSLHNGLILYKERVFLWPTCALKPKVFHLVHDKSLGRAF